MKYLVLLILSLLAAPTFAFNAPTAGPARGVFVVSPKLASSGNNLPLSIYQTPYIDGSVITALWNQIEPSAGAFDWSVVDVEINNAVANNKKIVIDVTAGAYAPSWLYSAPYNVPNGTFLWGNHDCAGVGTNYVVPVPWNSTYLSRYASMMAAFSAHLKSIPGAYAATVRVRITGGNTLTDELHLAFCSVMTGPTGNQLWQSLGYTPNNLIAGGQGWIAAANAAFPDKILSLSILQTGDLPLINNAGQIIGSTNDPTYVDATQSLITYALSGVSGIASRFAVNWNGFFMPSTASAKVLAAGAAGAIVGWQTNEFGGNANGGECPSGTAPVVCTAAGFQTLLDGMISTGNAQYIEIFSVNVPQFPAATTHAQILLATGSGGQLTPLPPTNIHVTSQ